MEKEAIQIWKLVMEGKIFSGKQLKNIKLRERELDDRVKRLTKRLGKTGEIFTS